MKTSKKTRMALADTHSASSRPKGLKVSDDPAKGPDRTPRRGQTLGTRSTSELISQIFRQLGQKKSKAKAAAARANGKLGGRPRKSK